MKKEGLIFFFFYKREGLILLLCTVCSSFVLYGLPDAYSLFCYDDEVAFEFVRMVAGGMIALGGRGRTGTGTGTVATN